MAIFGTTGSNTLSTDNIAEISTASGTTYWDTTEAAIKQQIKAELEQAYYESLMRNSKPFEETAEFRDFVVWLCGYTDRRNPPDKEEWVELRDKVKEVAAKFATAAHDRALKELKQKNGPEVYYTSSTSSP